MNDLLVLLLKISLVIFMAGNLLDMGLRIDFQDALRGLRSPRFVALTQTWGFVLCPALAYAITLIVPLEHPYAMAVLHSCRRSWQRERETWDTRLRSCCWSRSER